jgi:hypothetical protein
MNPPRIPPASTSPNRTSPTPVALRTCHLKPFSYAIVYRELPDVVRILGVRHTASDMASWADRD